ncbi:MAG: hypothetical protein ABIN94_13735 [Ferruginibacter sp.]
MRQLSIITIIVVILFPLNLLPQSNIQTGALGVFLKTRSIATDNVDVNQGVKNLLAGFGILPAKFEEHSTRYKPFLMTVKYFDEFSQTKKIGRLHIREDYYEKSKRQRKIGRILLGSGVVLIAASIAIASQKKEAEHKGVTLLLVGGPGIISSLSSIPFFIASKHSKRKMMNHE